jgi:acyl-CoA reductase-like NAD-dependent aldehyde dehydrogenase
MGNAAVLKPSELTPPSGSLVAQLFCDAGFPLTSCESFRGAGETGHALSG